MDVLQHDPAFHVLGADPVHGRQRLFGDGLVVETTIDPAWQHAAEDAVAATLPDPADPRAALRRAGPRDARSGPGRAGATATTRRPRPRASTWRVDGRRQPGSAFKPLVLATRAGRRATRWTRPSPAAPRSRSLPAGRAAVEVADYGGIDFGPSRCRDATRRVGDVVYAASQPRSGRRRSSTRGGGRGHSPSKPLPAVALGAEEVSPLDLADRPGDARDRRAARPPCDRQPILDRNGTVLWAQPPEPGVRAIDEEVAWQVTLALEEVIAGGTGRARRWGADRRQDRHLPGQRRRMVRGLHARRGGRGWSAPRPRPMVPPRRHHRRGRHLARRDLARFGCPRWPDRHAARSRPTAWCASPSTPCRLPRPATPSALIVERRPCRDGRTTARRAGRGPGDRRSRGRRPASRHTWPWLRSACA